MGKDTRKRLTEVESFLINLRNNAGSDVVVSLMISEEGIYFESAVRRRVYFGEPEEVDEGDGDESLVEKEDIEEGLSRRSVVADYMG